MHNYYEISLLYILATANIATMQILDEFNILGICITEIMHI